MGLGMLGVGRNDFFHSDHIVPVSELIPRLVKLAHILVAHGQMELLTVVGEALVLYIHPRHQHIYAVTYTYIRVHETKSNIVCRLLLEKKTNTRSPFLLPSSSF